MHVRRLLSLHGRTRLLSLLRWGLEAAVLVTLMVLGAGLIQAIRLALGGDSAGPTTTWAVSPVPVYGQLTPFELEDERGEPFGTNQLRGGVYVLLFTSSEDPHLAQRAADRLVELQARLSAGEAPAQVLTVDLASSSAAERARIAEAHGAPPIRRRVLGGEVLPLLRQLAALPPVKAALATREREASAWSRYAVVVDQAGGVRGFHELDAGDSAMDPLVEDVRCVNTCGPVPAVAGLPPGTVLEGAGCQDRRSRGRP